MRRLILGLGTPEDYVVKGHFGLCPRLHKQEMTVRKHTIQRRVTAGISKASNLLCTAFPLYAQREVRDYSRSSSEVTEEQGWASSPKLGLPSGFGIRK